MNTRSPYDYYYNYYCFQYDYISFIIIILTTIVLVKAKRGLALVPFCPQVCRRILSLLSEPLKDLLAWELHRRPGLTAKLRGLGAEGCFVELIERMVSWKVLQNS